MFIWTIFAAVQRVQLSCFLEPITLAAGLETCGFIKMAPPCFGSPGYIFKPPLSSSGQDDVIQKTSSIHEQCKIAFFFDLFEVFARKIFCNLIV